MLSQQKSPSAFFIPQSWPALLLFRFRGTTTTYEKRICCQKRNASFAGGVCGDPAAAQCEKGLLLQRHDKLEPRRLYSWHERERRRRDGPIRINVQSRGAGWKPFPGTGRRHQGQQSRTLQGVTAAPYGHFVAIMVGSSAHHTVYSKGSYSNSPPAGGTLHKCSNTFSETILNEMPDTI